MSHLYRENLRMARKKHRCHGCQTQIQTGDRYLSITGQYDTGQPVTDAYHLGCRRMEVKFNNELGIFWGEDWYTLKEYVNENGKEALRGAPRAVRRRFAEPVTPDITP